MAEDRQQATVTADCANLADARPDWPPKNPGFAQQPIRVRFV